MPASLFVVHPGLSAANGGRCPPYKDTFMSRFASFVSFCCVTGFCLLTGCSHTSHRPTCCYWHEHRPHEVASGLRPGEALERQGDEIVAAGQFFHTGTRVVLWIDPKGYDAYRPAGFYDPPATQPASRPSRRSASTGYGRRGHLPEALAARVAEQGWTLANLQEHVRQFVLHYDVAGTSRTCFRVLQNRGLSVHFMLDVDGTIYQTLDLKENAWHATKANDISVGVEIAQMGAYADENTLEKWYGQDDRGPFIQPPVGAASPYWTPDFIGRPARRALIRGRIHGREYAQYDYTDQQYEALIRLCAALNKIFPRLALDVPRDERGEVLGTVLSDEQFRSYQGLLGHYHVQTNKTDPGPAFDWQRVLSGARRERARWF
jgi:N-acetyl-anhydromuramyl-L-alanine amidase AmpD